MTMIKFTHKEDAMHQIALESLSKLIEVSMARELQLMVAANMLKGIMNGTLQYLDWSDILKEKSYHQILATEYYYHSLAFFGTGRIVRITLVADTATSVYRPSARCERE